MIKEFVTFVVIVLSLANGLTGHSQERGVKVGVGVGLGQLYRNYDSYLMVSPRLGYKINRRVEIGSIARWDIACFHRHFSDTPKAFSYGGYIDYNYLLKGPLRFFASGRVMHISNKMSDNFFDYDLMGSNARPHSAAEYGVTPGVGLQLKNLPLELRVNYLFFGYMSYKERYVYVEAPGCWGGGNWILDAGLRRLEIGAAVTF